MPPATTSTTRPRISADVLWRLFACGVAIASAPMLYVNWIVAQRFFNQVDDLGNFLLVALPLTCFLTALVVSIAVAVAPNARGITQGTVRGVLVGSSLFLHLMLWMLRPDSRAFLRDGVAYWASVSIPSFWFGLPLIIFSALVGARCGGAPIPKPVLALLAALLFWVPGGWIARFLYHYVGEMLERAFIFIFA